MVMSSSAPLAAPALVPPPPTRRHSLFGTEDRIILDIGSRYTKVGFSGEAHPRKVFKTVEGALRPWCDFASEDYAAAANNADTTVHHRDFSADCALQTFDLLWDLDISRGSSSANVEARHQLLKARLTILLRKVFSKDLLIDPTTRKVILLENPHMPAVIRETICQILFQNLKVPMIAPMSAPLLSVFATGVLTGIVLDVGILETRILPIYHGRPMLSHFATTTRGGRGLEMRLRALMLRYGRHIVPASTEGGESSIVSRTRKITPELLTAEVIEEIMIKCCFVSEHLTFASGTSPVAPRSTASGSYQHHLPPQKDLPPDWQLPHTGDHACIAQSHLALAQYNEAIDAHILRALRQRYIRASTTGHLLIPIKRVKQQFSVLPTSAVTLPPRKDTSSDYHRQQSRSGGGDLVVPGWLRERLLDFFFEVSLEPNGHDVEDMSLTSLLLHTLVGLPIDLRREMIGSVLVTGGYASFSGFPNRVGREVLALLDAIDISAAEGGELGHQEWTARSGSADGLKVRVAPSLASTSVGTRLPRVDQRLPINDNAWPPIPWTDQVTFSALKPLRGHVAILNDHVPSSATSATSDSRPVRAAPRTVKQQQERVRSGSAPLIPPLIYPWFGASLAGSLKLSSVEGLTREEWEMQERKRKKRESRDQQEREGGGGREEGAGMRGQPHNQAMPMQTKPKSDNALTAAAYLAPPLEPESRAADDVKGGHDGFLERPTLHKVRGGRGSFMGVVSGLDTGAFGGLSTVDRHMTSGGGGGSGASGFEVGSELRSPSLQPTMRRPSSDIPTVTRQAADSPGAADASIDV